MKYLYTPLILLFSMTTIAQNLDHKIYRANANSFNVASVLITGEKDAVLIDAQFTKSDAHRVVADILESGKRLTTIYVSHGDPDYYFGLEVFKQTFPEAIVYATEHTINHIKKTYQKKLDTWGPKLGANGTKNVVLPQVLQGNTIDLEGNTLEIKGLDGASPERSYVWIPALKAIVGGVNIYDGLHLWIADAGTKEKRTAWLAILNEMEELAPEIVVSAHALTNDNLTIKAITYSKEYLHAFEEEAAKTTESAPLITAMQKRYPNAGLGIALELGAKVSMGEMTW